MKALVETLARYDIGKVISIKRAGGTANVNFIIQAEGGLFFLRLRNPKYSNVMHVKDDHRLIEHLRQKKQPVPRIIRTRDGQTFVKSEAGAYEVSEFIQGAPFDGASRLQLAEAARALARLHRDGRDWRPSEPKVTIPKRYDSPDDFLPRWKALLSEARRIDDLDYILHQGTLANERVSRAKYDELSDWTIHGDYIPANLLFSNDRVAGIFDFDWAGRHPRLRDIADLVMSFCSNREREVKTGDIASLTRGFVPVPEKIKIALKSYGEILPLSKEDVELLPAFIRRRWIYSRAAATFKVTPERRLEVLTKDFKKPLAWLDANEAHVFSDPDLV
jgi:Ser/Thr protein kinase RdoA (MazF antagonist)